MFFGLNFSDNRFSQLMADHHCLKRSLQCLIFTSDSWTKDLSLKETSQKDLLFIACFIEHVWPTEGHTYRVSDTATCCQIPIDYNGI